MAWFEFKLIKMLHMREQVTNCDLVFVQSNLNQALWPGFQNKLINSKNILNRIGDLGHGVCVHLFFISIDFISTQNQ